MTLDPDRCWQAAQAKDPRFDGWIFCGVTSTGIYCRPSCPARTPRRENLRFFTTAAAAQAAGFRACKRCRPDATPGSPEWDRRGDAVGRAMRLIADGVVDREGVAGLAARLGYTERHLHRMLTGAVGAGPLSLARAQRAQGARVLLETTDMAIADVALAAGFQSVRQFNATVREIFAMTPSELRARRRHGPPGHAGAGGSAGGAGADRTPRSAAPQPAARHEAVVLRLPFRAPLDAAGLIAFLGARAVPGVEEVAGGAYRRSLRLPRGGGVVELRPAGDHVRARFFLADLRDLGAAVQRCRSLLDLDADPAAVDAALRADPVLRPLVAAAPGRRVPGAVDGDELALRAVLGQQVSVAGAATVAGRLTAAYGEPLAVPVGGVTHLFPRAEALAGADPETLPMPQARRRALLGLAAALASGDVALHAGADRDEAQRRLLALPGIGPWTVAYVAMRVLRDPDAFLPTDLGVRRALERLGRPGAPASALALGERWRPYRAYALMHLWGAPAASAAPARAGAARARARVAADPTPATVPTVRPAADPTPATVPTVRPAADPAPATVPTAGARRAAA